MTMLDEAATHWIPPFTKQGPRGTLLSFCEAWVEPSSFSTEPTCPTCRKLLEQDDQDLADLKAEHTR